MTTPLPPGMRRVDIDAEAATLADERRRVTEMNSWRLALDEVHHVQRPDGSLVMVRIRVSTEEPLPLAADLGARLAAKIHADSAFGGSRD
jgi:hypothetical protein